MCCPLPNGHCRASRNTSRQRGRGQTFSPRPSSRPGSCSFSCGARGALTRRKRWSICSGRASTSRPADSVSACSWRPSRAAARRTWPRRSRSTRSRFSASSSRPNASRSRRRTIRIPRRCCSAMARSLTAGSVHRRSSSSWSGSVPDLEPNGEPHMNGIVLSLLLVLQGVAGDRAIHPADSLEFVHIRGALGAKLDTQLTRYERAGFAGTVLVVRDRRIVLLRGYGLANIETRTPNTPYTRFEWNSMTKMLTGVSILQLAAAGRLKLDAPIERYLGEFPADKRGATVEHL